MKCHVLLLVVALGWTAAGNVRAQAPRVPPPVSTGVDVSEYAHSAFMSTLMTGDMKILESSEERDPIRAYMWGLFGPIGSYLWPPGGDLPRLRECAAMSLELGDEQTYLNSWVRGYVWDTYGQMLGAAFGASGPEVGANRIGAAQGAFGVLQDRFADGKTDGERFVKTLKSCDAPELKTIVGNARRIRIRHPSRTDYVPPPLVVHRVDQRTLQEVVGQYTSRDGTVTVAVDEKGVLTMVDVDGVRHELKPAPQRGNGYVFRTTGTPQWTANFSLVKPLKWPGEQLEFDLDHEGRVYQLIATRTRMKTFMAYKVKK